MTSTAGEPLPPEPPRAGARGFREIAAGGARLRAAGEVPDDWVLEAWRRAARPEAPEVWTLPLPPGMRDGEAVVKVYRELHLLPNQWLLRIARAGRARREGAGILAFAERGLPAPRLLLWGETRSWGPRQLGIVATERIDALTVADSFTRSPDGALLDAALDELARIHGSGLAHGDPWLRNFLDTRPRPTAFDLPSWSRLRPASQAEDLARFLASAIKLGGGEREARRLLARYHESGPGLPRPAERILRRARAYAIEKERP